MRIIFQIILFFIITSCSDPSKVFVQDVNKKEIVFYDSLNPSKEAKTLHSDSLYYNPKIVKNILYFKNGIRFVTQLSNLKYIGFLKTKQKIPYFILSGINCDNCDANESIYIWSPSDGEMKSKDKQDRYSYPGKEQDYETNKIIYENRMFYGSCLTDERVIWVQRSLNRNDSWDYSVFSVLVRNDSLIEESISDNVQIRRIINIVKDCKELEGVVKTSEP